MHIVVLNCWAYVILAVRILLPGISKMTHLQLSNPFCMWERNICWEGVYSIHWTATECMCACWTINHCTCVLIFFCLYDPFTCILSVHEGDNLLVLPVGYLMLRMCEQHLVVKSVDMYYQSSVSHDQHAEGKLLSRYAKIYMFLPLFAATSCFWTLYLLDCSTWDQQDLRIAMLYIGFGSLYP